MSLSKQFDTHSDFVNAHTHTQAVVVGRGNTMLKVESWEWWSWSIWIGRVLQCAASHMPAAKSSRFQARPVQQKTDRLFFSNFYFALRSPGSGIIMISSGTAMHESRSNTTSNSRYTRNRLTNYTIWGESIRPEQRKSTDDCCARFK